MRIALVVHKFPPAAYGGTEVYTLNLARGLSAQHEVAVFYRDDGDGTRFREDWEARETFRVWRVGRAFRAGAASPAALFWDTFFNPDVERSFQRFLAAFQPDLVHFQHLMLLSYRLPALSGAIPKLLTLHDYWFLCANSQLIWPDAQLCRGKALGMHCARCATARIGSPLLNLGRPAFAALFQMRDALVRRAALRIGRFISPSHFLREQYLRVGFPQQPFAVLENGVNVAQLRSFPAIPTQDGRLRVTYLGALAWQKGVHVLVEAARALPPVRFHLRIYGNPHTFPDYSARLRALANPLTTTFAGPVPNANVGRVLAETDVLAVPSLWYENSPVVIQEAHARGVPLLASDTGALPEKVGRGGMLVPRGDVSAWRDALLTWPAGRTFTPEPVLTVEDHVARLETLYQEALA